MTWLFPPSLPDCTAYYSVSWFKSVSNTQHLVIGDSLPLHLQRKESKRFFILCRPSTELIWQMRGKKTWTNTKFLVERSRCWVSQTSVLISLAYVLPPNKPLFVLFVYFFFLPFFCELFCIYFLMFSAAMHIYLWCAHKDVSSMIVVFMATRAWW